MTQTIRVERQILVTHTVDVLVAGSGIAGCVAAVAAARQGATTMVVDRFGYPGGNMGPGLICGAPDLELPPMFAGGLPGIPGELVARCEASDKAPLLRHYFRDAQSLTYNWLRMFQEAGVHHLGNVYAADPLMDGQRVTGLIVETKDGPRAIRARVVVDATGDADVAFRAGAATDPGTGLFSPGLYFALANVDIDQYRNEVYDVEPDAADVGWMQQVAPDGFGRSPYLSTLARYYRQAWEAGSYRFYADEPGLGLVYCDHGLFQGVVGVQARQDPLRAGPYGLVGAMVGYRGPRQEHTSGSPEVMNRIETASRLFAFETARFLVDYVPGFERAYLLMVSPYFGCRGGRSFIPAYRLTPEDVAAGRRHPDVVFLGGRHAIHAHKGRQAEVEYDGTFDWPYRQLLPQQLDGLLGAGRAAIVPPPGLRIRWQMLLSGQAAGVAAALAAHHGVVPRQLDVGALQRVLYHEYGVPLAEDTARLAELGLG